MGSNGDCWIAVALVATVLAGGLTACGEPVAPAPTPAPTPIAEPAPAPDPDPPTTGDLRVVGRFTPPPELPDWMAFREWGGGRGEALDRRPETVFSPDGSFETIVAEEALEGRAIVVISPLRNDAWPGDEDVPRVLIVLDPAARERAVGAIPTGDETPVLAAGRVVTSQGSPVPGAHVRASVRAPDYRFSEFWMETTTDEDGRFETRGTVITDHPLELGITEGGSLRERVPFEPGATGLRLVTGSRLEGSVLVPAALPLDQLAVRVSGPGAGERTVLAPGVIRWQPDRVLFGAQNEFTVHGLPGGLYDLRLFLRGGKRSLAMIRNVELKGDVASAPPLEYDGAVRRVHITVEGPEGKPVSGGQVWVRGLDDNDGYRLHPVGPGGSVDVVHLSDLGAFVAHAPGMAYAFECSSADRLVLRLEPQRSMTVRLQAEGPPPELADRESLYVLLEWVAPADAPPPERTMSVDDPAASDPRADINERQGLRADGTCTFVLPTSGWYRPSLGARRGRRDCRSPGLLRPVLVPDTGEPVEACIEYRQDDLDRVLESIRKPHPR